MRQSVTRWLHGNVDDLPEVTTRPTRRDDPAVTFVNGRATRSEASIRVPKHGLTPEEQKVLRQHATEAAQNRQFMADLNLARAVQLGAALKALRV